MKNLIIAAVGDNSLHPHWIKNLKDTEVWLIYYGSSIDTFNEYSLNVDKSKMKSGQKFPLIGEMVSDNLEYIKKTFSSVWMPDDDILMDCENIHKMFSIVNENRIHLAQPSLKDVNAVWKDLVHSNGPDLIRMNNVEIMAPVFSVEFLLEVYDTFAKSQSGWGLDFLWGYLLYEDYVLQTNTSLINGVVMEHTRPVGTDYSRFDIHPNNELRRIILKYQIPPNFHKICRI